jgi:hypothetical protein
MNRGELYYENEKALASGFSQWSALSLVKKQWLQSEADENNYMGSSARLVKSENSLVPRW